MKYSFLNDYSEGAHENIIKALCDTNRLQTVGYGMDQYCRRARELISAAAGQDEGRIHFLVGGTQTNLTVIAAVLRPHQGVIAASSGHINVHEAGAIEATGHKVIAIPSDDGKLTAKAVAARLCAHYGDPTAEHMVQPGMVYISQPTELGTVYSKAELMAISDVCREYDIPLYLDGARLGCALTCKGADVTLHDLVELTDMFYIGGTKMGALFGEALVINTPAYNKDFRSILKQRGGMLAKGRLLGIQFEELFTNELYFTLARHANEMAQRLCDGIKKCGYSFAAEPVTNQLFPILPKAVAERLREDYLIDAGTYFDEEHEVVRFCTSWATRADMIDAFLKELAECG